MTCGTVLASGAMMPEWAQASKLTVPLGELPVPLSLIVFTAAAHPCLPPIYHSCKSRHDFEKATSSGWLIFALISLVFGAGTYFFYGESVQLLATKNIGRDMSQKPIQFFQQLTSFASMGVLFKCQLTLIPNARPLSAWLSRTLGANVHPRNGGIWGILLALPVLSLFAVGACLLQSELKTLASLSGGFLMTINAFIFPAAAYLRICKPQSKVQRIGSKVVLLFGVSFPAILVSYRT